MHNEKVTICIPLYNCENTISKTLDSLLNQTYQNIIIKIFDNQSTDRSGEIARSYADSNENITYELNETNLGAEGNFTKCIQGAEGDYTAIFHTDDIYYESIVEKQVNVLLSDDEIAAVACHAHEINFEDKIIGERYTPSLLQEFSEYIFKPKELRSFICKYSNFITCPSVMINSKFLKNVIKVWNGEVYKSSADLDVWLRINKYKKFAFINKPLLGYRLSQESFSFRIAKLRTYKHDIFLVLNSIEDKSKEEKDDIYFLEFKDITLRIVNIFRSRQLDVELPKFKYNFHILLKKSLFSTWHLKYFIIGLIVYILRPMLTKEIRSLYWKKIEK